jgi:hypothetical protein
VAEDWEQLVEGGEGVSLVHVVPPYDGNDELLDVLMVETQHVAEVAQSLLLDLTRKGLPHQPIGRQLLKLVAPPVVSGLVDGLCELEEEVSDGIPGEAVLGEGLVEGRLIGVDAEL